MKRKYSEDIDKVRNNDFLRYKIILYWSHSGDISGSQQRVHIRAEIKDTNKTQ